MEATSKPHEEPIAQKGNVYVSTYGQTKVHSYLSPPDGLMVNTQIVEGRSSVVIFDGQLHLPYAEEVASYIKTIGKPVLGFAALRVRLGDKSAHRLVLVCSLALTPDLADCNHKNALDVMRVPEEFASPVTCFMQGQVYLAETAIGPQTHQGPRRQDHLRTDCDGG